MVDELEGGKAAVRVGAATTNLEMLNWSNKSGWTLPLGKQRRQRQNQTFKKKQYNFQNRYFFYRYHSCDDNLWWKQCYDLSWSRLKLVKYISFENNLLVIFSLLLSWLIG